ncbi:MAG TPA: universal stress protein [Chryseosolibacter sp.]
MKQILCVIDLTESSGKVLEVGATISKACGAHMVVLFPYRLIHQGPRGDISSLKIRLETEAREKFRYLKGTISSMGEVSVEFQPEIGFIADRINAYVRKNNIDMIIVGQQLTDPTNDIKGFDLQTLISDSKSPFVIVPAEVKVTAHA